MAFISAAVAAVGAWVGGLTWAAVGAFALKTAASMGLSFLAQKLSGKRGPKAQPFGVKGQLQRGADIPQAFILGNYATAGSLTYANTKKGGNTPNGWMTWAITLSDLPIGGVTGLWVNGTRRDILATGRAGFNDVDGFKYEKDGTYHLEIRSHDGTQTAADPWLVGLSTTERQFGNDAIGKGKAYAVMRAWINQDLFPNGFPEFLFEVEGIPLYNPAKDTSVGGVGVHRWSDSSTWESSVSPAVQLYNVLRGIYYDGEWVYGLQDVSEAQLPVAHWIAQINKCTAAIASADGPEPLYRSSAEIPVDAEVHSVIESLLDACSGRLSDAGGVYKLFAGAPAAPVMAFTDADILSTSEQTFTPFLGLSDTVNGVVAKYPSPAAGWQVETAPPLYRPDYEAEDGGRRLLVDVSLDFVPYAEQAQRLMRSALNEARRARRHTLTLPPEYWPLEPGDVIAWTSERNGYEAKQFRVDGVVDMPNADVMLDLTEVDPADYAWDTNTDFTPPAIPSVIAQPIPPQEILAFAVQASSVKDADSDARRPAIRATWDGDVSDVTAVKLQYRVKALGIEPHEARSDNVEAGQLYMVSGVLPDTLYEVRAKFIPASPRETLWTDWAEVMTLNILVEEKDISQIVRDNITDAKDTADDAVQDAAEAKNTADDVRAKHDALVDGFIGNLVDGFAGVEGEIAYSEERLSAEISANKRDTIPSTFEEDSKYWSHALSGNPDTKGDVLPTVMFRDVAGAGRVAYSANDGSVNRHVATKGYLPYVSGNTYRIRAEARHIGPLGADPRFSMAFHPTTRNYSTRSQIGKTVSFSAADTWEIFEQTWTATGDEVPYILGFVYFRNNYNNPGTEIEFKSISVEDITDAAKAQSDADNLAGEITSIKGLQLDGSTAFGVLLDQLDVSAGGVSATITQQGSAIADMAGNASSALVFRVGAGGSSADISLMAWDDTTGTGSVIKLDAQNVIATGTITANMLVVTDTSGNIVPDHPWTQGDFKGWEDKPQFSIVEQDDGAVHNAIRTIPGRYAISIAADDTGNRFIHSDPFVVKAGDSLAWSYEVAGHGTAIDRRLQFGMRWYKADGSDASQHGSFNDTSAAAISYVHQEGVFEVPEDAVTCRVRLLSYGAASSGGLYVADLSVHKQVSGSTLLTPHSIFTDQLGVEAVHAINVAAEAVTADKISVNELSAISANIGHFKSASSGERLEIKDDVLKVYDASNTVRAKFGNLAS